MWQSAQIGNMGRWRDDNGASSWYVACARVGYDPKKILTGLKEMYAHHALPNNLLNFGGGVIENVSPALAHWRAGAAAFLASGALLAVHWWTFFAAIQLSTVAIGLLTYASYPLFVTLLGWLVLVVPDWNFGGQAAIALALGVFSGFTFAALTLLNRRLAQTMSALPLVMAQLAAAGLLLLPLAATQLPQVTASDWAWLALLGVVFTGLAHASFTASLQRVRMAVVGVVAALEPVYGIAAAWLLLGELPSLLMLLGGALIIGASLLTLFIKELKP